MNLTLSLLEKLTDSGPRLPWIKKWLIEDVWNLHAYESLTSTEYLIQGESIVNKFEAIISTTADRIYHEFLSSSETDRSLLNVLSDNNSAVVVFDGLSLREIPIILKLSEKSGLTVKSIDCTSAAIPCETFDYVERELGCGRIAPSQLPGRKELAGKGISVIYTNNITQGISDNSGSNALMIWSSFPDNTYKDSGAKFENHFENIHVQFETAWINTVQQIKEKKRIIITSDHGYIFLGTGMDFPLASQEKEMRELNAYFGNDRYAFLSENPDPPMSDNIIIDTHKQVAMLKGRVKTRSTGEAATRLYKHGGLSLMEMLTPWIELEI